MKALKFNLEEERNEMQKQFDLKLNQMRAEFGEEIESLYDMMSQQNKQMLKLKKQKDELNGRMQELSN